MKPKSEIYAVSFLKEGYDGKPLRVLYMVGNQVPSYTGKPTKVLSIKNSFGIMVVEFEDGTSHHFGYDPLTVELFKRTIKTDGDTEEGSNEG